jgi:hypothetical protein
VIPGFSGQLVSEVVLEGRIAADRAHPWTGGLVEWRRSTSALGPAAGVRTLFESALPLMTALGLDRTTEIAASADLIAATVGTGSGRVALIVVPFGRGIERAWRAAVVEAGRRGVPWALVFDGERLGLFDAGRLYSRRFVAFDLDMAAGDPRAAAALTLVVRDALDAGEAGSTSLHALVAESDTFASSVCRSLRDGVLSASTAVVGALAARATRTPLPEAFEQALTIVYRLLFLLFAEARGLVPIWHPLYRQSYSMDALRDSAEAPGRAAGLWDALSAMARLAHAGCRAGDLTVTPFNGRLFAPSGASLAERRGLDDEAARRAVLSVSTRRAAGGGRERISYRDLGVEQLGAVYETLLEYEPRAGRPVTLERGSGARKATGSFYTPQPLADYLVRRTLGPLVRGAPPDRILALRVLDPSMGSGAFLVAACRFLASAYEQALIDAGACNTADVGEGDRAAWRRTIAERCLYGVDSNAMAVQLARLSLWLATLAADRPLTFLDHHLRAGDSLVGAWVSDLSRPPERRTRRRPDAGALPLFDDGGVDGAIRAALPLRFLLEAMPDDTIEQVRTKERTFAALHRSGAPLSRWKAIADAWCAPWFGASREPVPPEAFTSIADAILRGAGALPASATERYRQRIDALRAVRRFFHWELEFPEAFFETDGTRRGDGGFDAVLGNPPWDMVRADGGLTREDASALLRFTRDSGVYTAQSDGHANRYQLFLERAIALTRPGGRLGLVLPSGIATDHGSAALRRRLLHGCDVDAIVGFDNQQGVFPIHRSVRFLLITAAAGSPTTSIACRFGEREPAALSSADADDPARSAWFPVRLSVPLLERLSGADLAIPEVRTPLDVTLLDRAAALFPLLGSADGWAARFGRELNATDDREHLRRGGAGLPVVEGRRIGPFRVEVASPEMRIAPGTAGRLLPARPFERARLAYRDVASATNRVTLIAAVLPPGCVSTHTLFCLRTPLRVADQHLLCGLFNSLVVNYFVRMRVTTHVTTGVVEGLRLPTRAAAPAACREIAAIARMLARRDDPRLLARLNAIVASLYQLSAGEFAHVLDSFPLVSREERERARRLFGRT